MNELWLRLKALFRRRRFEQDLQDEVAFHLAMREEQNRKLGMDTDTKNAARREFGNATLVREQCREMRSFVPLETLWQDLKYGARLLRHSRMFTGVAVLTLALGIGANTAIFSITWQVLLQFLPVPHPEELVILRSPGPKQGRTSSDGDGATSFSYPMYKDIREHSGRLFTGVLCRQQAALSVSGLGSTERAEGELVSGNYFDVLGVTPALGRVFNEQDETSPGANPVAVLSYGYWTRKFANSPAVLNQQINVNGTLLTVVGVARAGFSDVEVGNAPDIFVPITMKPQLTPNSDPLDGRRYHFLALMARLRPGLDRQSAEAAIQTVFHPILEAEVSLEQIPPYQQAQFLARKLLLEPGSHGRPILQRDAREPLLLLTGMVGLVLIIACINIAGLLIARGEARQREIAVRISLGASRGRVLRQLLTEGLLLAVVGGAAGLAIAPTLLRVISSLPDKGGLRDLNKGLDWHVVLFASALAIATTLLFALVPALRLVRTDTQRSLKDQSASGASGSVKLRRVLMVAQVVFTTVLLAAAGLFALSLNNVRKVDLGLNPDHLIEFSIAPELNRYTPAQTADFAQHLRERIAALPGIKSVSAAETPVLHNSSSSGNITAEGYTTAQGEDTRVGENWVAPNYFATMNIPLIAGRDFRESDKAGAPQVVIINQNLARKYFAGVNPLGRHLMFRQSDTAKPDIEIVGVVADSKNQNPRDPVTPFTYTPLAQYQKLGRMTFYVRTNQDSLPLGKTLRSTIAAMDPAIPVYNLMAVTDRRDESVSSEILIAFLCSGLASLAAMVAALGLYGVMAYIVARRTREIGIRMALGASRANVAWLVLGEVTRMTALGLLIGLGAALVTGHFVQSQLFGVSGHSPVVLIATAFLLALVALLAGSVPARRAASVEPTVALRYE